MISKRHKARELAVQLLFQKEFNDDSSLVDFNFAQYWEEQELAKIITDFMMDLVTGVEKYKEFLDKKIKEYAENWDIKRMGIVDRNIIRIALYEMYYRKDIPPVVSVNEAVDLARDFSSEESGSFINGVLDRALRDLDRPIRTVKDE